MKTASAVLHATTGSFDQEVLDSELPVVVDLYTTWCGPCRMLAPLLEKFSGTYDGRIKFVKVNVEEEPDLAARFGVMGVPTILFFKDGRLVDQIVGLPPPGSFKTKLDGFALQEPASHDSGCGG
jgi:thioredoxin 1